jgi:hypothetical protein
MAIRIREKRDDGTEVWYWLRFNDYGVEKTPFIVVKKDFKGIKIHWVVLWSNPDWQPIIVDEYP